MKVKALSAPLLITLSAVIFAGCAGNNDPANFSSALPEAKTGIGIKYARNFNIDYLGNGVKLVIDSAGNKLLLVPKGINVPSGYDNVVPIETPIKRAVYTSTTQVGLMGALGDDSLYDSVVGVCTKEEQWTTPQVIERFRRGITRDVQCSQMGVGNIEEIIKTRPDLVFIDGNNDMQFGNLLDEVNIKHAAVMEWTEKGNAESLEWIKFFAAFYNLDEESDRVFEAKLERLDELYEKAAGVSYRPTVAYGVISSGVVYSQAGGSTFAEQVEKAGGIYILKDVEGYSSTRITKEEFLSKCRDADILIYGILSQYCPDKAFLLETEPLLAELKAFRNDKVYILDQGYYMNSAKVVEKFVDMVSIFHPDMFPGRELTLYRKLPD